MWVLVVLGNALRNALEDHGAAHAKNLDLYRVSAARNAELTQLDFGGSPPLLPRATVGTLFANPPGPTKYILDVNGMMLCCGLIWSFYAHVANHNVRT